MVKIVYSIKLSDVHLTTQVIERDRYRWMENIQRQPSYVSISRTRAIGIEHSCLRKHLNNFQT